MNNHNTIKLLAFAIASTVLLPFLAEAATNEALPSAYATSVRAPSTVFGVDVLERETVADPTVHAIEITRYRQPEVVLASLAENAIGGPSFEGSFVAFLAFERGSYSYTLVDLASETFYVARINLGDDLSGFSELLDVHLVNPARVSAAAMEDKLRAQAATVQATAPAGFGSVIGTVNGVTVYSNGTSSYVSENYSLSPYGMAWQCTEFVRRYYAVKFNRNIKGPGGDASRYFTNAADYGLKAYRNDGSIAPKVGDLLVSTVGHVGVIISVVLPTTTKAGTVRVAHQNWPGETTRTLALTSRVWTDYRGPNIAFTVAGFNTKYPVAGWSR